MNVNDLRLQVSCGARSCVCYEMDDPLIVMAFIFFMNAFLEFCAEQPK